MGGVCPICLEGKATKLLSCSHPIHIKCMRGMNKLKCPLCRVKIKRFDNGKRIPKSVVEMVEQNSSDYQKEKEEEEEREVMNMIEESIEPQFQILFALKYLETLRVPLSKLPHEMNVELDPDSGLIKDDLSSATILKMLELISSSDEDYQNTEGTFLNIYHSGERTLLLRLLFYPQRTRNEVSTVL